MKFFSSILFLLLFISSGNILAEEHWEKYRDIHLKQISTDGFACQAISVQEAILDVQDTNEIDGYEVCFIHPAPATDPLQTSTRLKAEVNAAGIPIPINSLLIDLPPPSLS